MILIVTEIFFILLLGVVIAKYRTGLTRFTNRLSLLLSNYIKLKDRGRLQKVLYCAGKPSHQANQWVETNLNLLRWLIVAALVISFLTGQLFYLTLPIFYITILYFFVLKNVRRRKETILKRIPFVMDMLILNMESGLDLISALEELTKMDKSHPLQQEIKRTLQNIHLGELCSTAFNNLSERTQIAELKGLAMAVSQSESMGSSLTDLLRIQAEEIRHRIFKMAEAQAQKAPVKILIPMIGFIFPVVFILLFVPIGLQIMKIF